MYEFKGIVRGNGHRVRPEDTPGLVRILEMSSISSATVLTKEYELLPGLPQDPRAEFRRDRTGSTLGLLVATEDPRMEALRAFFRENRKIPGHWSGLAVVSLHAFFPPVCKLAETTKAETAEQRGIAHLHSAGTVIHPSTVDNAIRQQPQCAVPPLYYRVRVKNAGCTFCLNVNRFHTSSIIWFEVRPSRELGGPPLIFQRCFSGKPAEEGRKPCKQFRSLAYTLSGVKGDVFFLGGQSVATVLNSDDGGSKSGQEQSRQCRRNIDIMRRVKVPPAKRRRGVAEEDQEFFDTLHQLRPVPPAQHWDPATDDLDELLEFEDFDDTQP